MGDASPAPVRLRGVHPTLRRLWDTLDLATDESSSYVSDRLDTYRRKRDFDRTPEPAGDPVGETDERRFVVQRHRASRLHYDFRLEIDGVLVSWAVPKGPTLDPKVRRGAFRTEDHPIEYLLFEGVIPSREYGGGDVIVWDTGTWQPDEKKPDASQALARGELHVDLFGTKLRGRFIFIRTSAPDVDKQQWLLLHKHDDFAVTGYDAEDHPKSAISGRTNDEVSADPDRLWRSDLPAERASIALKPDALSRDELAELDAFGASGTWHVYDRTIRLSNLDRELVGGRSPVTKRDLVRYAARIAPVAVPYLERRTFARAGWARSGLDRAARRTPRAVRSRGADLGRQLRHDRMAGRRRTRLCRHRARPAEPGALGRCARGRPALSRRARTPRRHRTSDAHRRARAVDLGADRRQRVR